MTRVSCRRFVVSGLMLVPLCAGATTAVGSQAQGSAFSSRVEVVRVDVSVHRDGQVIRGLLPADFEVLDNGVLQRVELVTFEETPVNVVLTLDVSGSVRGERLAQLRAASARLVEALEPGDAAALITFTDLVAIRSGLTPDPSGLLAVLQQPADGSDTSLDRLSEAFAEILAEARERYLISYTPTGVSADGWHDLTVRVRDRRAEVRARPGYLAGP